MTRALHRTLAWVHANDAARLAEVVQPYFPAVPRPVITGALQRYKTLGIWGRDPRLPRSGWDRLRQSLVSGGFVPTGTGYETAVDNSLAEAVRAEAPPPLDA
jgi:NitT/TauT family transport system substrate-binding protein